MRATSTTAHAPPVVLPADPVYVPAMRDALGRRKRYEAPEARQHHYVIDERKILICRTINRFGPSTAPYLYDFTKHLARNFKYLTRVLGEMRAGSLTQAPLLVRRKWQRSSVNDLGQSVVYELAPAGISLVSAQGERIIERDDPEVHRFMTSTTMASICLGARRKGKTFGDLVDMLDHELCPEKTKSLRMPLRIPVDDKFYEPDGAFVIQGAHPDFYFLESDRNNETVKSDFAKNAISGKIALIFRALDTKAFRKHFGIPDEKVKIAIATTSNRHIQTILDYIYSLKRPEYAKRIILKAVIGPNFHGVQTSYFDKSGWSVPPVMPQLVNEPWIAADGTQIFL